MNNKQILIIVFVLLSIRLTVPAQNEIQPLLEKAVKYEKESNYAAAVSMYVEILKIVPQSASVYNNLGVNMKKHILT
jgi:Flp pilus assembly protein TadD